MRKLIVSKQWIGHKGPYGKNLSWTHPSIQGVRIQHCGHPTALRPYYIPGSHFTFRNLAHAKWWVERGGHLIADNDKAYALLYQMNDLLFG